MRKASARDSAQTWRRAGTGVGDVQVVFGRETETETGEKNENVVWVGVVVVPSGSIHTLTLTMRGSWRTNCQIKRRISNGNFVKASMLTPRKGIGSKLLNIY